jgi:hypothetical protein
MIVPWSKLESCGGHSDPTAIPDAVNRLFSADASERKTAYWKIDNHAVAQGDLYSCAPYAARLIVDRLLDESGLHMEVVDILYELYNGSNPSILTVGPLAGKPIDFLCQSIVREAEPTLRERMPACDASTRRRVAELLRSFITALDRPAS